MFKTKTGCTAMTHSDCVREGIAAVRTAGKPWGTTGQALAVENAEAADKHAATLQDVVLDILKAGRWPWRPTDVARELNKRGIAARNGGPWHPATAARLVARLDAAVQAAQAYHDAKFEEGFRRFFGVEPPATMAETTSAVNKLVIPNGHPGDDRDR